MTTAWICQRPDGVVTAHDTEREALSEAALFSTSHPTKPTKPVVFRVDVEPPVGRWKESA